MKRHWLGPAALCTLLSLGVNVTATAQIKERMPLSIAREGHLFAGGKYSTVNGQHVFSGQLYAEFQIPAAQRHPYPIVFVPGGNSSGVSFEGTPDGREGWAQFFLREGYAVYVVDSVGRGRAAYIADIYGPSKSPFLPAAHGTVQQRITLTERYNLWPQAHLHTQWPGKGDEGDPSFDQYYASMVPDIPDFTVRQTLNRDAILALLEKIGPAILMTYSESGGTGWPVADARPDLVKAILAVEPDGPPFFNLYYLGAPEWFRYPAEKARPWGMTAVPLAYAPPAANPSELAIAQQENPDGPGLAKCWLQKDPARKLPNLQKMPILVVSAEASFHAPYDHCTVKYLEQAGVHPTFIKLADAGIHGNSQAMLVEKNNLEIAALISRWLSKTLPSAGKMKSQM